MVSIFERLMLNAFTITASTVVCMIARAVVSWFCAILFPDSFAKAFQWAGLTMTPLEVGAVLGWFSGFFARVAPCDSEK